MVGADTVILDWTAGIMVGLSGTAQLEQIEAVFSCMSSQKEQGGSIIDLKNDWSLWTKSC